MSEEKGKNDPPNKAADDLIRQAVGYARHIKNFMRAIQAVKDGVIKSANFNKTTYIHRVGDYTRVEISLDGEQEAIPIPDNVTDQDIAEAESAGAHSTNFMKALEMVKDGVALEIRATDKTIIYRKENKVIIDIMSGLL